MDSSYKKLKGIELFEGRLGFLMLSLGFVHFFKPQPSIYSNVFVRFIHLAKYLAHGFSCIEFKEELNELEKLVVSQSNQCDC